MASGDAVAWIERFEPFLTAPRQPLVRACSGQPPGVLVLSKRCEVLPNSAEQP